MKNVSLNSRRSGGERGRRGFEQARTNEAGEGLPKTRVLVGTPQATQNQEIKHPKRRGHSSHHTHEPNRRKEIKVPSLPRRSTPALPARPMIKSIHRRSTRASPSPPLPHNPPNRPEIFLLTSTLTIAFLKVLLVLFRRGSYLQLPTMLFVQ